MCQCTFVKWLILYNVAGDKLQIAVQSADKSLFGSCGDVLECEYVCVCDSCLQTHVAETRD